MAEEIRKRHIKGVNDSEAELVVYDSIGQQWVQHFLHWHSELQSNIKKTIDASRIKDTTLEVLQEWFGTLECVLHEYQITASNIYNMDESGFSIETIEAMYVIINSKIRQNYEAQPGRQEWVTSIECIYVDGTVIPPLIVFRSENLSTQWIPANIHKGWHFACNSKGWTSNEHGIQ